MSQRLFLAAIFLILGYGFWISPEFKYISAGVAIFLFGMLFLEEGFQSFSGGLLQRILHKSTNNLAKSLTFGLVTTALVQSSSLVSVITISFLSSGLLSLAAGIGIVFGANLGTTTGAWLIAGLGLKVNIAAYAMPMLVFGVVLAFQKSKKLKGVGSILAGLGFLFLGIHYMKEGFETFKDTIELAQFALPGYAGVFVYGAIGIVATVIMQSSHATMVIIITALAAGQITYENALALAIGANVGTTVTAIIGAMSANIQGKRLAAAHLVFNLATGLIAILFIYQLAWLVEAISRSVGIASDDYALKLAVFHTVFNLLGIVLMVPFINYLVVFLERVMGEVKTALDQPKYLDAAAGKYPDSAVNAVRNETNRLYIKGLKIVAKGIGLSLGDIHTQHTRQTPIQTAQFDDVDIDQQYERHIKPIFSAIILFMSQSSVSSQDKQFGDFHWLRVANKQIVDAVKDVKHMHKNILRYANAHNSEIRRGYDLLRLQIANTVAAIELIRSTEDNSSVIMLDQLKLELLHHDRNINAEIEQMIRSGKISANMATSLINDSAYTYNICDQLIQVCETLYVIHNPNFTLAQRSVALDDDEILKIIDKPEQRP